MKVLNSILLLLFFNVTLIAQTYSPTDAGSAVKFSIKNFGAKTPGSFTGLAGKIIFDAKDLKNSMFNVTVNANSINTDNTSRDNHLRKAEYFDVATHPLITIVSTKISESTTAGRYFFVGNLTIKGITKPIQFGFAATPSSGGYFFKGEFEINRRDFGVGGSSISMQDKLKVYLEITANKK